MVVIIFDTHGGLCNQFLDIISGINFCLEHNLFFTFRHCSFRNDNLTSWTNKPIEELFDLNLFKEYKLYINYYDIKDKLTNNNCYNLNDNILSTQFLKKNNILDQLMELNKKYVVLKFFSPLCSWQHFIDKKIYTRITPSKNIMEKYIEIKNTMKDEPYNFIHYRYEHDFTNYFKIKIECLDNLIKNIEFKNNHLNIYVATSNIKKILDLNNSKYNNLIYKNDDLLTDLNYEQRAFIDYMFGINSVECYGHRKSSFSSFINSAKGTRNYYD